jgi:hypothetical protein
MAFLPGITTARSAQKVKRIGKKSEANETDKKSGYRVSFTDVNKTPTQSACKSCNGVSRCPNHENTGRRETVSESD